MTITCLSEVPLPERCVVVFDLEDTLYPERDFVVSAFRAVSALLDGGAALDRMVELFDSGEADVFGRALDETGSDLSKEHLLRTYREHVPTLTLDPNVRELLEQLARDDHPLGLITDGRSLTQRNKIEALGLGTILDEIVISEEFGSGKPDKRNYRHFESRFPGRPCAYVADNPVKDFVSPNRLGWTTVCLLDRGSNIHPQDFDAFADEYLPEYRIRSLA